MIHRHQRGREIDHSLRVTPSEDLPAPPVFGTMAVGTLICFALQPSISPNVHAGLLQFVCAPPPTSFSVSRPVFEHAQPSRWIRRDPLARSEPSPIVPIFCALAPFHSS